MRNDFQNQLEQLIVDFELEAMKAHLDGQTAMQERKALSEAIVQLVQQEVIGEDEQQLMALSALDNFKAVERCVGRNQLRQSQRAAIKEQK